MLVSSENVRHLVSGAIGLANKDSIQKGLIEGLGYPFDCPKIVNAIVNLAEQLKPEFHKYNLVLSDDRSGHIVAAVLGDLINDSRKARGEKDASVNYLAKGLISKSPSTVRRVLLSQKEWR